MSHTKAAPLHAASPALDQPETVAESGTGTNIFKSVQEYKFPLGFSLLFAVAVTALVMGCLGYVKALAAGDKAKKFDDLLAKFPTNIKAGETVVMAMNKTGDLSFANLTQTSTGAVRAASGVTYNSGTSSSKLGNDTATDAARTLQLVQFYDIIPNVASFWDLKTAGKDVFQSSVVAHVTSKLLQSAGQPLAHCIVDGRIRFNTTGSICRPVIINLPERAANIQYGDVRLVVGCTTPYANQRKMLCVVNSDTLHFVIVAPNTTDLNNVVKYSSSYATNMTSRTSAKAETGTNSSVTASFYQGLDPETGLGKDGSNTYSSEVAYAFGDRPTLQPLEFCDTVIDKTNSAFTDVIQNDGKCLISFHITYTVDHSAIPVTPSLNGKEA